MLIKVCLLVFVFSCSCLVCADIPIIADEKVIFQNGYSLELQKHKKYFSEPQEALKKGLPVYVEEEATSICDYVLIVRKLSYFEGATMEIQMLDNRAQNVFPIIKFTGELILLERNRSFVIAGIDAHNYIENTFVYTCDGVLKNKITQLGIFSAGASDDGSIFWLFKASVDNGEPYTIVFIYNSNGELISESKVDKVKELNLNYQEKVYKISIPAPDFPG